MSDAHKNIVEAYSHLFEGLNALSKIELIEQLTKLLKRGDTSKDEEFYKSFGAFASKKSPEEIIADIKSSRKFRNKEIKL
jgi:hypothetical protein